MTLTTQLTTLETVDLIRRAPTQPELEYLFRHALVQEAAYSSLLKQNRRELHHVIGETLEHRYAERLDEFAAVLAQHFAAAGDDERALTYYTRAGDAALRVYANLEAIQHYTLALEITQRGALHVSFAQLQQLYLQRGRALELRSRYEEALANYAEMEALAVAQADSTMELQAVMAQATIRTTANRLHDAAQGLALLTRARALAQTVNDRAAEAKILWNLLLLSVLTMNTSPAQRIEYGEQGLALARALNLREQEAFLLCDLWYAYATAGQWARCTVVLQESVVLWRELRNDPMLAESLMRIAVVSLARGDFAEAMHCSDEAARVSHSIGNVDGQANSRAMVGIVYGELGEVAQALAMHNEAISVGAPVQNVTSQGGAQAELGWLYGWLGDVARGLVCAQRAYAFTQAVFPVLMPWGMVVLARLYLLDGQIDRAAELLQALPTYPELKGAIGFITAVSQGAALARAELAFAQRDYAQTVALMDDLSADMSADGVRFMLADALYWKGRAQLAQGLDSALGALQDAHRAAASINARRIGWQIVAVLSELATQRGNLAEAQAYRQQARDMIAYIAAHCPPELRASFLNLPDVVRVNSEQ